MRAWGAGALELRAEQVVAERRPAVALGAAEQFTARITKPS
jgi:hypothetical protein